MEKPMSNQINIRIAAPTGNSEFIEALVAACAIIAHADGEVAASERRSFVAITRSEPSLRALSADRLLQEFEAHERNFRRDPELAREIAVGKLKPIRKRRRAAHAIVEACRLVIPADGVAHPAEFRALAKIKRLLGIEPEGGATPIPLLASYSAPSQASLPEIKR
jgi:tellurite resistance protein